MNKINSNLKIQNLYFNSYSFLTRIDNNLIEFEKEFENETFKDSEFRFLQLKSIFIKILEKESSATKYNIRNIFDRENLLDLYLFLENKGIIDEFQLKTQQDKDIQSHKKYFPNSFNFIDSINFTKIGPFIHGEFAYYFFMEIKRFLYKNKIKTINEFENKEQNLISCLCDIYPSISKSAIERYYINNIQLLLIEDIKYRRK